MSVKKIQELKEKIKKIKQQILTLCYIKKNQSIKKSFEQLDKIEKLHYKLNILNDEIFDLRQNLKSSKKGSRKKSRKGSRKKSRKGSIKRKLSRNQLLNCYCSKTN